MVKSDFGVLKELISFSSSGSSSPAVLAAVLAAVQGVLAVVQAVLAAVQAEIVEIHINCPTMLQKIDPHQNKYDNNFTRDEQKVEFTHWQFTDHHTSMELHKDGIAVFYFKSNTILSSLPL